MLPKGELFSQKEKSPVIIDESPKSPKEILKTSKAERGDETELPSGDGTFFTPAQDSAFKRAIASQIPIRTLIDLELKMHMQNFNLQKAIIETNPWILAQQNIDNIPAEYFIPSGSERVRYQENILASQYIPFVRTINPNQFQFPLRRIGQFLGVVEDVSPTIKYEVEVTSHIQIVIYSVGAKVVATIFDGMQTPGRYSITWNLRSEDGKPMPTGDYIAEVRIGDERFIRKRIVIP